MSLDDDPFDWQETADGRIRVFRGGREVAVVAGRRADKLRPRLAEGPETAQHVLARVTGNYRRGNERRPGRP